ncbi:MAG: response regulator [Candidatus Neomarinimicrobiota bacterium]
MKPCHLLLVEDNESDVLLLKQMLASIHKPGMLQQHFDLVYADRPSIAIQKLAEEEIDLILLDLSLPESRGLDTFTKINGAAPNLPIIVMTSLDDEEVGIQAVRSGAQDYLIKGQVQGELLVRSIMYAIERKQAEEKLRESEARFRTLVEHAPEAIIVLDADQGRFVDANGRAVHLFGIEHTELLGLDISHISPEVQPNGRPSNEVFMEKVHAALTDGNPPFEWLHKNIKGESFSCEERLVRLPFAGRDLVRASITDITERKRLEREIIEISEREKSRIGQDLHDDLGQFLRGIGFMSAVLEKRLRDQNAREAEEAARITEFIITATVKANSLARQLFPADLKNEGLFVAIEALVSNMEEMYGIRCDFKYEKPIRLLDPIMATHLLRIVQEAVNNAVKHGQAEEIVIELTTSGNQTTIEVRDDGIGLSSQPEQTGGLGLHTMNYRAEIIGASFSMSTNAQGGVTVTCTFHMPDHLIKEFDSDDHRN